MQHKITSEWMPADDSTNRLELAATEQEDVVALRDSFEPDRQIFSTRAQVDNFVHAAHDGGRLRRILGPSMRT